MGYGGPANWSVRFRRPQKIPSGMQCRDHHYIEDPNIWVDAFNVYVNIEEEVGWQASQDSLGDTILLCLPWAAFPAELHKIICLTYSWRGE